MKTSKSDKTAKGGNLNYNPINCCNPTYSKPYEKIHSLRLKFTIVLKQIILSWSTHSDEELKEVFCEHSEHQDLFGTRTDYPPYLLYHKSGPK